ncbi:fatty acid--CoA ligase [Rubrobacter xylanophilus]|uniref:Fatty acid--CoA ligase n=1 Tax=Rubrobacter xylanophilus TaxID=49319 RepID=A0A510HH66_9ACTN|nr:class I adenylate-forming enzyme family protein [Rubrobacter xylanophilus]BBL79274.1 fatty acid--CoA ligase [Rubrobacter xylanophilus]
MPETNSEEMKTSTVGKAPRWSREVVRAEVAGYPSLIYAERPRSVPELLVDARRWRGREHLVQGERRITFEAHERAVARVAWRLKAAGIRPKDRVLLFGANQIEWVVAFWAVQCLGGVAVLGNAWWSEPELREVTVSIQPALALTDSPRPAGLPEGVPCLHFGDLRHLVDDGGRGNEPGLDIAAIEENDPSMIIFSSGTTGVAKGVILSHRSVVCNLQNLLVLTGRLPNELPESHPGTVSLLSVPLFHLAGIQVACSTLLTGGSLIFLEGRFDAGEVLRLIEKERVRVWGSVPTMVSRVIDHPDFARFDTSSLSSIPMGGASVSSELREKVHRAFPSVRGGGGSLYGLTEAGGVLAAGSGPEMAKRPGCVGRPLPVVEIKIKDPSPEGVGEILARTPTAMSGYWGKDSSTVSPEGWLSTGDLGRMDEEGYLYVVGRSKDIIIRGGENIASGHVERHLLTHPDVEEAAVVPIPHPDLGEEVGAAIVLRPRAKAGAEEIKAHVAKSLARFEVPSRWWIRRQPLPTNPTGKILRREVLREWLERGGRDIMD